MRILATTSSDVDSVAESIARQARSMDYKVMNRRWADDERRVVIGDDIISVDGSGRDTTIRVPPESANRIPDLIKEYVQDQWGSSTKTSTERADELAESRKESNQSSDYSDAEFNTISTGRAQTTDPEMYLETYWEVDAIPRIIDLNSMESNLEAGVPESFQVESRTFTVNDISLVLNDLGTSTEVVVKVAGSGSLTQEMVDDIIETVDLTINAWASQEAGGVMMEQVPVNGAMWDIHGISD